MHKQLKIFFNFCKCPHQYDLVLKNVDIFSPANIAIWPYSISSHPECFSSKVMVKEIFQQNGGQRNAFAYVSHTYCSRYLLIASRPPTQARLCSNLVTIFAAGTEIEPKRILPWKGWSVSVEVENILPCNLHIANEYTVLHWDIISSFSGKVE